MKYTMPLRKIPTQAETLDHAGVGPPPVVERIADIIGMGKNCWVTVQKVRQSGKLIRGLLEMRRSQDDIYEVDTLLLSAKGILHGKEHSEEKNTIIDGIDDVAARSNGLIIIHDTGSASSTGKGSPDIIENLAQAASEPDRARLLYIGRRLLTDPGVGEDGEYIVGSVENLYRQFSARVVLNSERIPILGTGPGIPQAQMNTIVPKTGRILTEDAMNATRLGEQLDFLDRPRLGI